MIDNMIRCKDLLVQDQIQSLAEWFLKCPPAGKAKQWKDGRSAKETAKHWIHTIPQEFINILNPLHLDFKMCSPEYVTHFDKNGGNGRNHDLLVIAENETEETVVVSVESKVDEEFGNTIAGRIQDSKNELIKRPNSKAFKRTEELRQAVFGTLEDDQLLLRYQLLTAIAGTIAEAKKQKTTKAIFIVQTFLSDRIDKKQHLQNQGDLNSFIYYLTQGKYPKIVEGEIVGPIKVPGNVFIPNNIDLWIGKYEIGI